jgi:hypothetical protein
VAPTVPVAVAGVTAMDINVGVVAAGGVGVGLLPPSPPPHALSISVSIISQGALVTIILRLLMYASFTSTFFRNAQGAVYGSDR